LAIIIYPLFHFRRSFNISLFYCQRTSRAFALSLKLKAESSK